MADETTTEQLPPPSRRSTEPSKSSDPDPILVPKRTFTSPSGEPVTVVETQHSPTFVVVEEKHDEVAKDEPEEVAESKETEEPVEMQVVEENEAAKPEPETTDAANTIVVEEVKPTDELERVIEEEAVTVTRTETQAAPEETPKEAILIQEEPSVTETKTEQIVLDDGFRERSRSAPALMVVDENPEAEQPVIIVEEPKPIETAETAVLISVAENQPEPAPVETAETAVLVSVAENQTEPAPAAIDVVTVPVTAPPSRMPTVVETAALDMQPVVTVTTISDPDTAEEVPVVTTLTDSNTVEEVNIPVVTTLDDSNTIEEVSIPVVTTVSAPAPVMSTALIQQPAGTVVIATEQGAAGILEPLNRKIAIFQKYVTLSSTTLRFSDKYHHEVLDPSGRKVFRLHHRHHLIDDKNVLVACVHKSLWCGRWHAESDKHLHRFMTVQRRHHGMSMKVSIRNFFSGQWEELLYLRGRLFDGMDPTGRVAMTFDKDGLVQVAKNFDVAIATILAFILKAWRHSERGLCACIL